MKEQWHLQITGRVQGVCYRMYAREQARRLGVRGWVRNCPDGSVEIVAEGSREDLTALEDGCRRGPPMARVQEVTRDERPATGTYDGFDIVYGSPT